MRDPKSIIDTKQPGDTGRISIPDVVPGSFQQLVTALVDRLATEEFSERVGMLRLHGRWTDPGRASGKYYYAAKVVDDGGAQVKIEIPASLVASCGVAPGQSVVVTGRVVVKMSNYGLEIKLAASEIRLADAEPPADAAYAKQGRMTLERLRALSLWRVPFPEKDVVSVAMIQSASAVAQVANDCLAELTRLGSAICVVAIRINMLDPVAIAAAIDQVAEEDIVMLIRGGGDAADFEVFDDPRVVTALATQKAHRVIGLGHTGNRSLLDVIADYSANTPAQAGAYVREIMEKRQQQSGNLGKEMQMARDRVESLEKERRISQEQLQTAAALLAKSDRGVPWWAVAAAFFVGAAVVGGWRFL